VSSGVTLAHVGVLHCFWTCSHSEDSGRIHAASSWMLLMVTSEDSGGIHAASSGMLLMVTSEDSGGIHTASSGMLLMVTRQDHCFRSKADHSENGNWELTSSELIPSVWKGASMFRLPYSCEG
jgi:hypothetical protein